MARRRRKRKGRRKARGKIVVRFVNHPGTKAQPYLEPSLQLGRDYLRRNWRSVIDRVGLKNKPALISGFNQLVKRAAFFVQRGAQQLAPVDKGVLRRSINVKQRRVLYWTVGTNVQYAEAVERGTRPHVIRPRVKKVLAFKLKRKAKG